MGDYLLSRKAEKDLVNIARYTIKSFGVKQARQYRDGIERCFRNLKENPDLGSNAEELAPRTPATLY